MPDPVVGWCVRCRQPGMQAQKKNSKSKSTQAPAYFIMPKAPDTTVTKLYTEKVGRVWAGVCAGVGLLLMTLFAWGPGRVSILLAGVVEASA